MDSKDCLLGRYRLYASPWPRQPLPMPSSLNNSSSAFRSNFTKSKLEKYGCTVLNGRKFKSFEDDIQYEEGYDEQGMDELIKKVAG